MDNKVVFKDGQAFYFSRKNHKDPYQEEPLNNLTPYLGNVVELEEGTTLEHVLNYVFNEYDIGFFDKVFGEALGNHPLAPFYKDFQGEPNRKKEDEPPNHRMEYLELSWDLLCGIWDGHKSVDISASFNGVGPQTIDYGPEKGKVVEGGFAVEFSPLNDLKVYPLKLNTECKIFVEDLDAKKKGKPCRQKEPLFVGEKYWTVYDILYGILFEISYCGSPSDRSVKLSELDQAKAEIEDNLKEEKKHNRWPPKDCGGKIEGSCE